MGNWKRPWCWEGLGAGGEGHDRGWDGWMASLTWWTWVWVNSRSWWWTKRPGVLRFMGSQRVGHDWATDLNWTEWARMRTGNSLSRNAKWQIKMLKRRCSISQSRQWKAQQWCRVIFYDQKWQKWKHLTMWGTGENKWKLKILYPLVEVKIVSPLWSVIYQYLIKLKVKSE